MSPNPFKNGYKDRIRRALKANTTNAAANALFGPTVENHSDEFKSLRRNLKEANMDVLYRTYASKMILFSLMGLIIAGVGGTVYVVLNQIPAHEAARFVIGLPLAAGMMIFGLMYLYPSQKAHSRQKSIDENLPFAMNHLSAIATSGIQPSGMFELLAKFDEYGSISDEAEEITRRVNAFGEDFTTALREVADRSPSEKWNEILYGILSTVETGGNLEDFLKEKAEEQLFEYKIEKEKEIERLSTYASFYTAILIAAPVFLVTILSVMNLLGGQIAGFSIRNLMWFGVHILIPGINTIFVLFLGAKVS